MDKVTKFYPKDATDNPDNVLEQAIGEYDSVLIIGYDKDEYLDARASTNLDHSQILWLIEKFKHNMLSGRYRADDE